MYAPREEKHPEQRVFTMALYVVMALAAIAQYSASYGMVIAGVIILILAGFMIKMQRLTARETIYASHVEWTANTMSIGCKFLFPIAAVVSLYLVYKGTDIESLRRSVTTADSEGDLGAMVSIVKTWAAQNEPKVRSITTWCLTPPIFWWVRRCWHGLVRADKSEPIDYPDSIF
jgi:hypothetical protein